MLLCYCAFRMKCPADTRCPVTRVIDLLSDKWTMHVLYALRNGPSRFCELERDLRGISSRTLTLKLKELTEKKLITKTADGLYKRTKRGAGLDIIERAMKEYHNTCLSK